jgi:Nucleotidyltransferase of unknown function (DUF6036)
MAADNAGGPLPSPWNKFLIELDRLLNEPLERHCIGGFVLVHFYGLPRTTGDIDYCSEVPGNLNLDEIAGQGSPLHKKHRVWLHRVAVANIPEEYQARQREMVPGEFKYLKLLVPDPYDCILSKLERNNGKDRDDADYLFRSQKLSAQLLCEDTQRKNATS